MRRIFQILAVVLLGIAAFYLYRDEAETSFVTGVLAACSFFLSIRFQIKERVDALAAEAEEYEDDDHPDEDLEGEDTSEEKAPETVH